MAFRREVREEEPDPSMMINVVPLMDVMLVLLVIFMIAMPSMALSVRASSGDAGVAGERAEILIRAGGALEYDGETVTREVLSQRLADEVRRIRITAEDEVTFDLFAGILAEAARGGRDIDIAGGARP